VRTRQRKFWREMVYVVAELADAAYTTHTVFLYFPPSRSRVRTRS